MARSLFGMVGRLTSTVAKLKRCQQTPMPDTATTIVEMTCLQGLADLERLEGPWLDGLAVNGIKHKQPSVTVGALHEFDALLGLGINCKRGNFYRWRQ